MRIHELIDQELKKIAVQEIKNLVRDKEQKELLEILYSLSVGDELENIEVLASTVNSNKKFARLKNFNFAIHGFGIF